MRKLFYTAIAFLAGASLAHAELIMTFDTREPDTAVGTTSVDAGTGNPIGNPALHINLENSSLVFGSGTDGSNNQAQQFVNTDFDSTTIADAITGNDFLSFTVDAKDGYQASLDSLTVRFSFQNGSSGFAWGLFSSETGFGAADQIAGQTGVAGSSAVNLQTIDLSTESSLQDVAGEIEFRLVLAAPNQFVYAGVKDDSLSPWPYDPAIELEGTVEVIPEPATAVLLGLGIVIGLWSRRAR